MDEYLPTNAPTPSGVSAAEASSAPGERTREDQIQHREAFARWISDAYDDAREEQGLARVGYHNAWLMYGAVAEYERRVAERRA